MDMRTASFGREGGTAWQVFIRSTTDSLSTWHSWKCTMTCADSRTWYSTICSHLPRSAPHAEDGLFVYRHWPLRTWRNHLLRTREIPTGLMPDLRSGAYTNSRSDLFADSCGRRPSTSAMTSPWSTVPTEPGKVASSRRWKSRCWVPSAKRKLSGWTSGRIATTPACAAMLRRSCPLEGTEAPRSFSPMKPSTASASSKRIV